MVLEKRGDDRSDYGIERDEGLVSDLICSRATAPSDGAAAQQPEPASAVPKNAREAGSGTLGGGGS